ncbi:DUF4395 family protein [Candidatus Nephthysia bennettiae]|uniref:DUF4395 family protein n=1 Tax=Candidatus Nephthysia bennettiae TaxID=3127016 RepID=A0A934KCT9_9BACT|nr:DUF4395 family protein [Candidatus Dormibacteraeota bacterium]MBJ7612725.1 DUF4395 family protein [Candidatus Dormibacteraeota bacterium]
MTARKVHQWAMVSLVAAAFLLGGFEAPLLLAVAGVIMLAGRFWWQLDLFRQLTWRLLEPRGLLRRREFHEDHESRRIARVLGGTVWLLAAALVLLHLPLAAWTLAFLVAVMVALDAALDFCALCFVLHLVRR